MDATTITIKKKKNGLKKFIINITKKNILLNHKYLISVQKIVMKEYNSKETITLN